MKGFNPKDSARVLAYKRQSGIFLKWTLDQLPVLTERAWAGVPKPRGFGLPKECGYGGPFLGEES